MGGVSGQNSRGLVLSTLLQTHVWYLGVTTFMGSAFFERIFTFFHQMVRLHFRVHAIESFLFYDRLLELVPYY